MICYQCKEDHPKQYDVNFVNGICLPCQGLNELAAMERRWAAELVIYTQRTGFVLEYCDFFTECMQGNVDRANLHGLPELINAYRDAERELQLYTAEDFKRTDMYGQLQLFINQKENENEQNNYL